MKKNMLTSWTPGADSFFEGRNVYRVSNKQDSDLLRKNINKKIYIKVYLDTKYNYEIWSMIPLSYIGYDDRKPWKVPLEEKSWNQKARDFVPSRYKWKIKNMKKEVI
jgi:hypothetical protein